MAALLGVLVAGLVPPATAHALSRADLRTSLSRAVLGAGAASAGAYVKDLTTDEVLYESRAAAKRIPASVEKLFTTAAALRRWRPGSRIVTRVRATGPVSGTGRLDGELVLVGAGDPTLDRAAIGRLARAVRRAGIRRVDGSVVGDESWFDRRRGGPRTGGGWDPDMGGVLGALTVGRGFSRGSGPALAAARHLVRSLRARGVRVRGRTGTATTPAGARTVADVRSAPLAELVRRTNAPSDNYLAEMLLKGLGAAPGRPGTTASGAKVAHEELRSLDVRPRMVDGSGLSRANRTSARTVVRLFEAMRRTPQADTFERSLAVAGRSGTLRLRMRGTSAAGNCRGKTGTLNRVSTLAGLCTTREGHTVAFALLMNDVTTWRARAAQDRAALAMTSYVSHPLLGRRRPD